jgi:hypothetical protein
MTTGAVSLSPSAARFEHIPRLEAALGRTYPEESAPVVWSIAIAGRYGSHGGRYVCALGYVGTGDQSYGARSNFAAERASADAAADLVEFRSQVIEVDQKSFIFPAMCCSRMAHGATQCTISRRYRWPQWNICSSTLRGVISVPLVKVGFRNTIEIIATTAESAG